MKLLYRNPNSLLQEYIKLFIKLVVYNSKKKLKVDYIIKLKSYNRALEY